MSTKSENVKSWRKRTKQRIIESMGGECQICGYDKCHNALELHHLESDKKDFGLGSVRANIKSWTKIVEELRKCVLLCANCHREVHDDKSKLPENYKRFDESYTDYKHGPQCEVYDTCICGYKKPKQNKYCSHKCAQKSRYKVDWDSIDLLSMLKKYKTFVSVGEKLGVSDASVYKRAKKLNITKDMFK